MADLPVSRHYDIEPPDDVKRMWVEVRAQEYRSRIARIKQDIDDLIKGQVLKLQAELKMLELSLEELEKRKAVDIT